MTTLTKKELKAEDQLRAREILLNYTAEIRDESALVLITQQMGKGETDYLRVQIAYIDKKQEVKTGHLTWAIAQIFGYSLRDINGYHFLAIGGGGYSKSDEIARSLAFFYDVARVRYELN
jgi:hypothetical protein